MDNINEKFVDCLDFFRDDNSTLSNCVKNYETSKTVENAPVVLKNCIKNGIEAKCGAAALENFDNNYEFYFTKGMLKKP